MKTTKTTVSLLLALLLATLAGACVVAEDAPLNDTGYPIVNEPVTYTVMNSQNLNGGPWGDDMAFFRAMETLTNITFEFSNTPASEWATKMNLSLASGDLPDVYMSDITQDNLFAYGVQGKLLLEFSDMIDAYMPNLVALDEKFPGLIRTVVQSDGGIYSFPRLLYTATSGIGTVYMDTSIMRAAGIEKEPETIDEFYEALVAIQAYKAEDPDFIAFVPWTVVRFNEHAELFFIPAFGDYVTAGFNDDGTGTVFYNGVTDQFYRYLEFANKLYSEGLLNNDLYTMDSDTALSIITGGQTAVTTYGTNLPIEAFDDGTYSVSLLGPLTSAYATEKKIAAHNMISNSGIAISAACENPQALLRWFDIYYAQEDVAPDTVPGLNAISPWIGIRGDTYEYTDETENFYVRPQPLDEEMNAQQYIMTYGAPQNYLGLYMTAIQQGGGLGNTVKGLDSVEKVFPYTVPQFPLNALKFLEDEMEEYTTIMVDINAYVDQMKAKFITGVEPLSNYQQYVETLERMGINRAIELVQAAYDRYNQ